MRVVFSYGMGVESTAVLFRLLNEPETCWFNLEDLTLVTAMTGDEFTDTHDLVTDHALPLLNEHNVRYVHLARNGLTAAEGLTVLSDSTQTERLHIGGAHRLSDELRHSGTTPQVSS